MNIGSIDDNTSQNDDDLDFKFRLSDPNIDRPLLDRIYESENSKDEDIPLRDQNNFEKVDP
jgi:hypothetical protein